MAITTTCGGCGKTLAVADEFAGRQARCPECGTIYTVPGSTAPAAPQTPLSNSGSLADTTGYSAGDAPLDLGAPSFPAFDPPSSSTLHNPYDLQSDKFWMLAPNGAQYGPADSATLARWFAEGRVGQNYKIRKGENGPWQPASNFKGNTQEIPPISSSANPYATQNLYAANPGRKYPKTDQSGLVLAMGILSFACPIFGIIGLIVGGQAISNVQAGHADPATLTTLRVGFYLSMAPFLCMALITVVGVLTALLSS